jgi:hypothetical protein
MWRVRTAGLRVIAAGYGSNPNLPGQVAHQYTDGTGYSPNLPQGAPPFGNCDMNSADGLTPQEFAAARGITMSGGWLMALTDDEQTELLSKVRDIWDQLHGPNGAGWPQLGQNSQGQDLTPVDAIRDPTRCGMSAAADIGCWQLADPVISSNSPCWWAITSWPVVGALARVSARGPWPAGR